MSKIENIINKIIDDAKLEAENIVNKAMEENEKKLEIWKAKKSIEEKKLTIKAHEIAESKKNKILSDSKIHLRDSIIIEKLSIINKLMDNVKDELKNMDNEQYIAILKDKLKDFSDKKQNIEIMVPFDKKELLEKLDLGYKFVGSESIKSGFIIQEDKIFYNNDFNELINNEKEKLIVDISKIIFD